MALKIVGFTGNHARPSKTHTFASHVAREAAARLGGRPVIHDLSSLGPAFPNAHWASQLDERARNVVHDVVEADLLIVGSPTYKGSYTGLFKHFFDLLDPASLIGKPVLILATGGGERHALVVEHQLRPLLGFFQAFTLPTAIYASDSDFTDGALTAPAVLARVTQAVDEAEVALTRARVAAAA